MKLFYGVSAQGRIFYGVRVQGRIHWGVYNNWAGGGFHFLM